MKGLLNFSCNYIYCIFLHFLLWIFSGKNTHPCELGGIFHWRCKIWNYCVCYRDFQESKGVSHCHARTDWVPNTEELYFRPMECPFLGEETHEHAEQGCGATVNLLKLKYAIRIKNTRKPEQRRWTRPHASARERAAAEILNTRWPSSAA